MTYLQFYYKQVQDDPEKTSVNSDSIPSDQNPEAKEIFIEENFEVNLEDDLETATKHKWQGLIGDCADIVVANLTKLKGIHINLILNFYKLIFFFSKLIFNFSKLIFNFSKLMFLF